MPIKLKNAPFAVPTVDFANADGQTWQCVMCDEPNKMIRTACNNCLQSRSTTMQGARPLAPPTPIGIDLYNESGEHHTALELAQGATVLCVRQKCGVAPLGLYARKKGHKEGDPLADATALNDGDQLVVVTKSWKWLMPAVKNTRVTPHIGTPDRPAAEEVCAEEVVYAVNASGVIVQRILVRSCWKATKKLSRAKSTVSLKAQESTTIDMGGHPSMTQDTQTNSDVARRAGAVAEPNRMRLKYCCLKCKEAS